MLLTTRLLVAFVSLGVAAPAAAAAGKHATKKKPRKMMVFVAEKGASKEIVAAVEEFCVKAEAFYGVGVLQKKPLKKKAAKCADAKCLAKLGKRKKVATLVVGRAHPADSGVRFAFQTVDVGAKEVVAESELVVASAAEAHSKIARAYFRIAGITTSGFVSIANAPEQIIVDGADVEVKKGKVELPPGPHTLRVNDEEQEVMVLPKETRKVEFASLAPPPEPAETVVATPTEPSEPTSTEPVDSTEPVETEPTEVAAVDDPVAPLEPEPTVEETVEPAGGGLGLWSWVGIGAAGTGAVLLGVGAIFGNQTSVELQTGTTQLEARALNHDARTNATTANALFIGGGVLALAGATLFAFDFLSGPTVSATVAPAGEGAALVVGGVW